MRPGGEEIERASVSREDSSALNPLRGRNPDNVHVTQPASSRSQAAAMLSQLAAGNQRQQPAAPSMSESERQAGLELLERLARQHRGTLEPSGRVPSGVLLPAGDPNRFFLSQSFDPRFNPQAPRSTANCGPTSLAMALVAFHKVPYQSGQQELILQVRRLMTGRQES